MEAEAIGAACMTITIRLVGANTGIGGGKRWVVGSISDVLRTMSGLGDQRPDERE